MRWCGSGRGTCSRRSHNSKELRMPTHKMHRIVTPVRGRSSEVHEQADRLPHGHPLRDPGVTSSTDLSLQFNIWRTCFVSVRMQVHVCMQDHASVCRYVGVYVNLGVFLQGGLEGQGRQDPTCASES